MANEKREASPSLKYYIIIGVLLILTVGVVVAILLTRGGNEDGVKNRVWYEYFDTVSVIYDYSEGDKKTFAENAELVRERLEYYNKLFDIYNEYDGINNLATLNGHAGEGAVRVDGELIEFLEYCKYIHTLTKGEVNIALGAVLSIWHDYREAGLEVPSMDILEAAAEHCDINSLILDKNSSTAEITDPEMSLDVGAIAKGYAVEKIAKMLSERGISGYALDIGGNLRVIGTKPDGSGWISGVQNPSSESVEYVYTFELIDSSAVTSGDYQRYYTVGGVRYHHIIDKDTLLPATGYRSVTVITKDSALADSLSTALFSMGQGEGKALVSEFSDITVVWVLENGNVVTMEK